MELMIDVALLAFLALVAFAIVSSRHLFVTAMLAGLYSLLAASLFVVLDAVDVAFTEAAVGAGISTILFLGTLSLTECRDEAPPRHTRLALLVVFLTGSALVYGTLDMPDFGDPGAPANTHVASRYIDTAGEETGVPNIVTAVLASYRGYDTLGEAVVVFTAGIGVLALLGRSGAGRWLRRPTSGDRS